MDSIKEKIIEGRDKIAEYMPVDDSNKETAANVVGAAVLAAGAYGLYSLATNSKVKNKISRLSRSLSKSLGGGNSFGNSFGKRRRRRSRRSKNRRKSRN